MTDIKHEVFQMIHNLLEDKSVQIADGTPLIGSDSFLDSMKLVELCIELEDLAGEIGFEFDWTSETAMSKSRSMFRTAGSLTTEFITQMDTSK